MIDLETQKSCAGLIRHLYAAQRMLYILILYRSFLVLYISETAPAAVFKTLACEHGSVKVINTLLF